MLTRGAEQLREWMDRQGFGLDQTAEALSVDFTFVSKLVNGHRRPGLQTAIQIENVTGIAVRSWAIEVTGEPVEKAS